MKHVVIVGGGFAGLNAARILGGKKEVKVTVIDRTNHHLFQPLLYQVAMAGLSPAEIAYPIRSLLANYDNIDVLLGQVSGVNLQSREIKSDFGCIPYDYLILACGAKHSYFGHEEWEAFAPGLKTLEQATEIRRRVLTAFELAEREPDAELRRQLLTFVIVGGGPTGVELAGALGEISRYTLAREFRRIDPTTTRILLIEGAARLLPAYHPELSKHAQRDLESLGVTVWLDRMVTDITSSGVRMGDEYVHASTVMWAAGIKPSRINQSLGVSMDPQGRVMVRPDLSLDQASEVFVVGDQAHLNGPDGRPLPGLAPVAMQQGRHAARQILRDLRNKPRIPFHYIDKGMMATIGKSKAVAQMHTWRVTGFAAWLMWLFVHIYYLIGFKNRFFVLYQWAWSYFTYQKGARLIVNKDWKSYDRPPGDGSIQR
ncbi:MAG TPA: NAD(P)/FAD-dependent oxidoreductase [Kiritimatiellia bacterium]|nr:NAD(P)/FAD-dependent oxidoreductase [Kiritimatiellia bacterium]